MKERKYPHYFKDVSNLKEVDVYRVLKLFNVTDPCIQHSVKKLLVAGGRGGGKDISKDVQEAIDTLERWKEIQAEDAPVVIKDLVKPCNPKTNLNAALDVHLNL